MTEHKSGIGLKYAFHGLITIVKEERNFRIHLVIALFVILTSFVLRLTKIEWIVIIITIHFVLLMELINSVVERIIDYLKPEIHPQAKKIKDMSASVVLITAFMSIIVGLIIFLPKLNIFY